MKTAAKLWIGIVILVVISPLGLLLPHYFKAGPGWGESPKLSGLWQAPLPDYAFRGWEEKGLPALSFAYIMSAVIGIVVVVLLALIIGKLLSKKGDKPGA